jgi:hypothetical protein
MPVTFATPEIVNSNFVDGKVLKKLDAWIFFYRRASTYNGFFAMF